MSRKKGKHRKHWGSTPITFAMEEDSLRHCRMLSASAIDAIATGIGTDDHIAQLQMLSDYCLRLCDRLAADGSVAEPEALADVKSLTLAARDTIAGIQDRFSLTSLVRCGPAAHGDLLALLDANDALDKVATRRQARDVMVDLVKAIAPAMLREVAYG